MLPSTLNTFYSDLSNIGAQQMLQLLDAVKNVLTNSQAGITSLKSIPQSTIQLFTLQAINDIEHNVEQAGNYIESQAQSFILMNKTEQLQLVDYFISLVKQNMDTPVIPGSLSDLNTLLPVNSPDNPPANLPANPPANPLANLPAIPPLGMSSSESKSFEMPSYVVPPSLQ